MRAYGLKSMIVLPVQARGRMLGALTFVTGKSGRRYSSHDLAIAEEFARRVATGIDNARLYEQAQRATRAREELLAIVSHDLKNPLNVILMSASMMDPAPRANERRRSREQIETIKRSAKRMNRLIEDLLDTASIEAGSLTLQRRRLAVFPIVRDAIEAMQPLAAKKSLNLKSELPADTPGIFADPSRLQQVFANLLGNAIKFTPDGGTITVRAEATTTNVRFSVADTGSGIPEEDLPRLFERFWQARRTARQGTGLGLSIVKGIVVAHGGRIWVESGIGAGSTFIFTLPLAARDLDQTAEAESAEELISDEILRTELLRAEIEKYTAELEELGEEVRKRELSTARESTRVARELAERATQFRRDFMGLASHELREPLTGIERMMGLMQTEEETPPTPRQEKLMRGMFASVARLTGVIESLLKHALVEGGRLTTWMSTFDVQQITREVIAELRPYAEKKRIELRFTIHSEDLLILSDPELTRLILLNLVGNAIKFMENGIVEISTDRTAEGCRFAVRDSGPGIPAEERVSIFDPFAKWGDMTQQSNAAMGLGLSLVREVASALGGHVELESEIGRGSTFTVTLPSLTDSLRDPHDTLS